MLLAALPELDGFIDAASNAWPTSATGGLVPLHEEPRSDKLPVAVMGTEFLPGLTHPLPPRWNGSEVEVREAPPLRPDPRVEDPDDDVGAVVGVRP